MLHVECMDQNHEKLDKREEIILMLVKCGLGDGWRNVGGFDGKVD